MEQKYVDIKKRTLKFSIEIIRFLDMLPSEKKYWIIGDQLMRSATSIGSNIVEATGSPTRRDFINFYHISLKSTYETRYWLTLLNEIHKSDKDTIRQLIEEVNQIGKILTACILKLKGKR